MNVLKRLTLAIVFTLGIGIVASYHIGTMQCVRAEVTNFPNGISSFGMTVIPNVGGEVYSGNVWFVDSGDNNGSDGAHEPGNRLEPYSTLDAAVSRSGVVSGANNGDVIFVLPGHSESITTAGGLDLDVAGLTIVFLGKGNARGTITFAGSATTDMDVDAADITVRNARFICSTQTAPIDVNSPRFSMIGCQTEDGISGSFGSATNWIVTDSSANQFFLANHTHFGTSSAPTDVERTGQPAPGIAPRTFLQLNSSTDSVVMGGYFYGNFDHSIIESTLTGSIRLRVYGTSDNPLFLWNENATIISVCSMTAATTGFIGPNIMVRVNRDGTTLTDAIGASGMQMMRDIQIVNADGESSTNTTITQSTN